MMSHTVYIELTFLIAISQTLCSLLFFYTQVKTEKNHRKQTSKLADDSVSTFDLKQKHVCPLHDQVHFLRSTQENVKLLQ